jgi:periplasmic protein TonB
LRSIAHLREAGGASPSEGDLKRQPLSTDFEPERSSKQQNLAAGRTGNFSGIAPDPAAVRSFRRRFAKIVAGSLLVHGCLVLALVLFDPAPNPSGLAREIPVEVVTEPLPPEQRPAAQGETTQAPSREPRQTPETEANPKPANEAMSGPNPVSKPAAPQPSATDGPRAPAKRARKDMARKQIAQELRPAARLAGGPRQNGGGEHRRPVQTGLPLPFDSGPDSFRAVAVPLPAANGGEAKSYKVIVLGLLERVKLYPETARQRGAKGIAIIGFVLDKSGRIASVSLLRSSGEADLDAESVALVNRPAPFPPPPPGAQVSFSIEVAFGMES